MPYTSTNTVPSEIKLFYQIYGEKNSKPHDAILFNPDTDQEFGQDVIDDFVAKGLWDENLEKQLENKQLYFKVFREDEDMIHTDAVMFENVRLLPNQGLLSLEESLQNNISSSFSWLGSFIPQSVKQTAFSLGNSLAQWTEDKLTGFSAYSGIPTIEEMDKEIWQKIVGENSDESEILDRIKQRGSDKTIKKDIGSIATLLEPTYEKMTGVEKTETNPASKSFTESLLNTAWSFAHYAYNNPLKTFTLALAAVSVTNNFHLPKIKFENQSLKLTNGINTATDILTKLAVAKIITNEIHSNTPFNTIIAGMSFWNPVAATTPEFQVNTYTTNDQQNPAVISFANGSFLVTWDSLGQDGSSIGIYGQRFNATGEKIGSEFQINTYTTNEQRSSSVASFLNAGFVVTWYSDQDGSGFGVYGQRFSAIGTKIGAEFQINTYTTNQQYNPSVISFADDSFVVTWTSYLQDGADEGIYGQLFNATGGKKGIEFLVNSDYSTNAQMKPSVASFADGGFIVAWESLYQDGSDYGIYGQRFNALGVKIGSEFRVNTFTANGQHASSVASFTDGSFVITWWSDGQDGSGFGIYGQLFNAANTKIGPEFRANTYRTGNQYDPSVAIFIDNSFVITWSSFGQDGSFYGVYGQRFNATGAKIGTEFQINTFTTSDQQNSAVASFADGSFVVTWMSGGIHDGSGYGVYGRIFTQPRLGNNTLPIMGGQTKIITKDVLSASAPYTDPGSLVFMANNVLHGRFEFVTTLGIPIFNFTQQQILDAQVQFVHDGTGFPPAYDIIVSELVLTTSSTPATIIFSNAVPVLTGTGGALSYIEKNSAKAIDPSIIAFDADSTTLTNATIQFTSSFFPEDILAFTNQSGVSGVYNNAIGVLSLIGTAPVTNYQTALRNITYFNPS